MRTSAPRRALLVALALLPLGACAPAVARSAAEPTTVLVVRHAERLSDEDRDTPLSPAGEARARALADALADAGVTTVLATQYQRTQNTARPLAERLGLPVGVEETVSGQGEASAAALARKILGEHAGETVLVVGHSNTVPLLVRALGGADLGGELAHEDYDNLFVVLVPAGGEAEGAVRTLRTRYGADDGHP